MARTFSFTSVQRGQKVTNAVINEVVNATNDLYNNIKPDSKNATTDDINVRITIPQANSSNTSEVFEKIYRKIGAIEANMSCATNNTSNCGGELASQWYGNQSGNDTSYNPGNNGNVYSGDDGGYQSSQESGYCGGHDGAADSRA